MSANEPRYRREARLPVDIFDETIIVADNDSMMRGLLRTVLEQRGRTLLLCVDGEEAVALATHTVASLVLLDLRMPRMGGIEACLQIRGLPRYATIPIVILTVFDAETLKRRALKAGATSFLAKPFSRTQLLQVVNPLIEAHKNKQEVAHD